MPDVKLYAIKEGPVHTVYVDFNAKPMPISGYSDRPLGGYPRTFNSLPELQANFPGYQVECFSPPPKANKPQVIRKDAEKSAEAAKILGETPPTPPTQKVPEPVGLAPLATDDGRLLHAQEFLKRLEVAREYANKKNQRLLDIQITAIKELIEEVFGQA